MVNDPKKTYSQSEGKIRGLWNIARRLIGEYEDFDRRLSALEEKFTQLSRKITSTIDRINNV